MQHTETHFHTALSPEQQPYASPQLVVIEMETEGSILTISGEDGTLKPW